MPELIPAFAPAWADVFGEDRYGVFAEFGVGEVRFAMRWIPPGSFLMGSPDNEVGRWEHEGPQHEVTISRGYWLGETPVTQAQWAAVIDTSPSRFVGPQRPVEQVTWEDCQQFCVLLKSRHDVEVDLPSEAQWEHACRAGTSGLFGDADVKSADLDKLLDPLGWYHGNSDGQTHDVAQKAPNNWGLYDMHGNVWEWCRDGRREYTAAPAVDPEGDTWGADRVIRGGSWDFPARFCRAACRGHGRRGSRGVSLGFRLFAGQEPGAAEPPGAERPER